MPKRMVRFVVAATCLLSTAAALAADPSTPIRVACVGDSITFGATIKDRGSNSYPAQLAAILGTGYDVRNFGVNGATMLKAGDRPYWKTGRFKQAQDFQPAVVVIMLGTNDSKPRNWEHKEDFETDYVEMVKTFQGLASKPIVWVCRPMPAFPGRWGINDKTIHGEIIPLVDKVAAQTGAKVLDLYAPMVGKGALAADTVHPNAEGAKILAESVARAITGH